MWHTLKLKISARYRRVVNSIAFYPAGIGLSFLLLSFLSIQFDFSDAGKNFKSGLHWLSLRDATTARSIISSIVSGIISLTVFSFSMVMIVLNQAAANMSNRVLDKLIGNRFQQVILGIYIGTIVYALFLLSTIRDIDSGIYIPSLSTYLLILLTVLDIFLFIYFLHYITQSVKYDVIIQRLYNATKSSLLNACCLREEPATSTSIQHADSIAAPVSGIYEGFDTPTLLAVCQEYNCSCEILPLPGSFLLSGRAVAAFSKTLPEEAHEQLAATFSIHNSESIAGNFFYGFKQLMEIAIKALSPGINDPNTAVISLRALFRLYAYRAKLFPAQTICDKNGMPRITVAPLRFEKIFEDTLLPVWDYGKEDRIVRQELRQLLTQLQDETPTDAGRRFLMVVERKLAAE